MQPSNSGVVPSQGASWSLLGSFLVAALFGGCAHTAARPPATDHGVVDPSIATQGSSAPRVADEAQELLGYSVEGRPIWMKRRGTGPRRVLILATIHGDEWAGTPLLSELEHHLDLNPSSLYGHTLYLIPVANPDGYAKHSRTNANGVDLNRNFMTENRRDTARHGSSGLSEPEARALAKAIEKVQPELVLSLHQPLACIDWDGPGKQWAERMAAVCRLPAKKLGSRPGSLGSWVGVELGVPILTIEFHRHEERASPEKLWERYGAMLLVALQPDAQ